MQYMKLYFTLNEGTVSIRHLCMASDVASNLVLVQQQIGALTHIV